MVRALPIDVERAFDAQAEVQRPPQAMRPTLANTPPWR
jgi:hypothetical protein